MFRLRRRIGNRHLVRAEAPFDLLAIHHPGASPALGRAQHDHRPAWSGDLAIGAGLVLNALDLLDNHIECDSHGLVHQFRFLALHKVRRPAVTTQQLVQFLMSDTREHRRVGDLPAIKMQYG